MNEFRLYGLIVGLTVTIMTICDSLVYKTVDVFSLKITASGIVFSLCYLLSTISTEVYGYKLGGRTVWIIVICQTLFVLILNAFALIQPDNNAISKQYYQLFHEFWRVMVGTWISVPASYFCNGFIVSRMKIFFAGRFFFARYLIASMLAQAVLLLTAYPISLSSKYSGHELVNIIATTWSYKVVMSVLLLPLGYYLVSVIKKIERTDYFDWEVSYNPLTVFRDSDGAIERNRFESAKA